MAESILLVEIFGPEAGTQFVDDDQFQFVSDSEFKFEDSVDVLRMTSGAAFAGARDWQPDVLGFDPIAYRMDTPHGGMVRLSGAGNIQVAMQAFDNADWWFPATAYPACVSITDGLEYQATKIMDCTFHQKEWIPPEYFTFDIYQEGLSASLLLSTGVNYAGETVVLPRAFGNITFVTPIRRPDANGHQVYDHGYLSGTVGVDWHVYDDGVNVDSNVTNATASTFEYTVTPVGEITVCGTGTDSTLINIFNWACGVTHLNLSYNSALATAFTASCWVSSQETLVSFLDRLAAYACHLFYIKDETLYLVDMGSDNGTVTMTEFDFFPSSITYAAPVALLKANWTDRTAVEDSTGKHIMETPQKVSVVGSHPYGPESSIDCFQSTVAAVTTTLTRVLGFMQAARWETSIPLTTTFPAPGLKISAVDASMGQAISIVIRASDIEYDFENYEIKIAGAGVIS